MDVSVIEVDPQDDALLRQWHDSLREGASAGRVAPLMSAYEEMSVGLRDPGPRKRRTAYAAWAGGAVVGALLLELPLQENLHLAELEIAVPPGWRRQGVGAALYAFGAAVAESAGRTTYLCEIAVPTGVAPAEHAGSRFAAAREFVSAHCEDHLVLDLPMPGSRLAELMRTGEERHAGYSFVAWTGGCPEAHVAAYAELRSVMERDSPSGELDVEPPTWTVDMVRVGERRMAAQGYTQLAVAARDSAGTFVGYSLMLVSAHQPGEVLQEDTLVLREHRGHRLGTALKARNMQRLIRDFPDRRRVHTWTAGSNGPMQKVNRDFGFRPVEQLREFQRVGRRPGAVSGR